MDREVSSLKIFVGSGNVGVSGLVSRDDNAHCVREVTDSGILQGVELVFISPTERLAHLQPLPSEYLSACLCPASPHFVSENVTVAVMAEKVEVDHHARELVVKSYLAVALVLADGCRDEDTLFLQVHIADAHVAQFLRTYHSVILHHAGEEEQWILLTQIAGQLAEHLRGEGLTLLGILRNFFNFFYWISRQLVPLHKKSD